MIYEPREDSFLLQKYVKKYSKGRVLDMGTGSGIQALTALEKTKCVVAVDINEETLQFFQAIYNEEGELVEIHEKFPIDKGHSKFKK